MKTLILDYSEWRCGDDGTNRLGRGNTALYNGEGFMCCLGQFTLQLSTLEKADILHVGYPSHTNKLIEGLTYYNETNTLKTTELSMAAVKINDNLHDTPKEKTEKLKSLFLKHGYEIQVINTP